MDKSKIHSFFTPYLPHLSSEKLEIPAAFIVRIDKALSDEAILRNRIGKCWQVRVVRSSSRVYFKNGWRRFVKANNIQIGEFLVFNYDGDHIFDVLILGRSGCEKNPIEYKQADEDEDDDEEKEQGRLEPCGSGRKKEGQNEGNLAFKIQNSDGIDLDEYLDFKNPYLITRVQPRRAKLFIPLEVIEVFKIKLQHKAKMFFRGTSGKEWPGEVTVWKDGRVWIKGWNTFCRWNRVTIDDRCICELILEMGIIQVHIIRAKDLSLCSLISSKTRK